MWTGRSGDRLTFDDTLYRTVKAGRFVVRGAATIAGRQLGEMTRLSRSDYYSGKYGAARVNVNAGDVVEYLQARAEGTCFIRVSGSAIDADRVRPSSPMTFGSRSTLKRSGGFTSSTHKTTGGCLSRPRQPESYAANSETSSVTGAAADERRGSSPLIQLS